MLVHRINCKIRMPYINTCGVLRRYLSNHCRNPWRRIRRYVYPFDDLTYIHRLSQESGGESRARVVVPPFSSVSSTSGDHIVSSRYSLSWAKLKRL